MPPSQDDFTAAPGAEPSPEPGPPDDATQVSGDAPLDALVIKRLRLLSSGVDDTTQVWEALTGRTLLTLGSRAAFVGKAIWSPDGRLIAAITALGARFWDATTGMQLPGTSGYSPSDGILYSLAWSPNGRYLASASERYQFSEMASASELQNDSDQVVRVWEAATGRDVMIYRGHTDRVLRAVWSPDSKYLASAGLDMTVRVWAATTGQTEYIYRGHESFWQQFFTAQAPERPAQAPPITLAHPGTRAGPLAASAHLTRPQDTWPPPPAIQALAWSPDGQYIASGGFDGGTGATVQVWQPG